MVLGLPSHGFGKKTAGRSFSAYATYTSTPATTCLLPIPIMRGMITPLSDLIIVVCLKNGRIVLHALLTPDAVVIHMSTVWTQAAKTPSGLAWKVLSKGKPTMHPGPHDKVILNFIDWTPEGEVIANSIADGERARVTRDRLGGKAS